MIFKTVTLKIIPVLFLCVQLSVKDLQAAITYMHDNKKYKKVCMYEHAAYSWTLSLTYLW